jgi:hypothetical protein
LQGNFRVGVRDREQRGIGDVQIRLIERDLHEIVRVSLLEPVTLDLAVARGLQTFVLPNQRIDHVGAKQVGTVDDDAISVPAHCASDGGELTRRGRRELKAGRDKVPAHTRLGVVPALKSLTISGRDFRSAPPLILDATQAFVPEDRCTQVLLARPFRRRRGDAFKRGVECGIDWLE